MKNRIITLFTTIIFLCGGVYAQVSSVNDYVFSCYETEYVEIAGGTIHGNESNDNESFNNIEVGFSFSFNGDSYNSISINTNGFIAMGNTIVSTAVPLSYTGGSNSVISPLGTGLIATSGSEIMSLTEGESGNHVFTVQWKNYSHNDGAAILNFQIKLYEGSNKIEFIYGNCSTDFAVNINAQVGLRGGSSNEFNNRKTNFGNGKHFLWSESRKGTSKSNYCTLYSGRIVNPGLVYSYTEPQSLDASITNIVLPENVVSSPDVEDLIVEICNPGSTNLSSLEINYTINTSSTFIYNWEGSLDFGECEEVNIGTIDFNSNPYADINVWGHSPNGAIDENENNNSFRTTVLVSDYCNTNIVNDEWYYISDVMIGNLHHYDCGSPEVYSISDYSYLFDVDMAMGVTYNYTIDANSSGYLGFWLDFNDDKDYNDAGEFLGVSDFFAWNEVFTGNISIPTGLTEGKHKLRIRYITASSSAASPPGANDACTPLTSFSYEGDCHEYMIDVYNPSAPPACVSNPYPINGQTNVYYNTEISWNCENATSYDIYFGQDATPDFIDNTDAQSFDPGLLTPNTQYYWKVISRNDFGIAMDCLTWTFTTGDEVAFCATPQSDCEEWYDKIDDFYMVDLIHEDSGCSNFGYGDFTDGTYTTNLIQGENVTWSANYGNQDALAIWIDFNDDGEFNATDEFVYHTQLVDGDFVHISEDDFNIPINANLGPHRMRVRSAYDYNEIPADWACGPIMYGETHDYVITIIVAEEVPSCAFDPIPENGATNVSLNQILEWSSSNASSYDIYFGEGIAEFIDELSNMSFNPGILAPNTTYQWYVIPKNSFGDASGCEVWSFTTGEELYYCEDNLYYGDAFNSPCDWGDYLTDFAIGDLALSGMDCNEDYGVIDMTDQTVILEQGEEYLWTASLAISNTEYIAIWIDFSDNGIFEESELFYTADAFYPTTEASGNISIPIDAQLGEHRMRIRTKGTGTPIEANQACSLFQYGQAYDLTVNIVEMVSYDEVLFATIIVYPNPFNESFWVSSENEIDMIVIYNNLGQVVYSSSGINQNHIKVQSLVEPGIYLIKIFTEDQIFVKKAIKND